MMPLIVIIVGSVLDGIGIWATAIMAFGVWYHMDLLVKARYRRSGAEAVVLRLKCNVWMYLWGFFFAGMLTVGLLYWMAPATWALVLTLIAGFGWVVSGLILQDYRRALRRLPEPMAEPKPADK